MFRKRSDIDRIPYDPNDTKSIYEYAKELVGTTLGQICGESTIDSYGSNEKNKGDLGQIVEYSYFFIEKNNGAEPDINETEIKTTNLRVRKRTSLRSREGRIENDSNLDEYYPKERLSICNIDYDELPGQSFDESFHHKLDHMIIIFFEYDKETPYKDRKIIEVKLWELRSSDLAIIKQDWKLIKDMVSNGQADKLSGRLTTYLEPAPKGKNKQDTVTYHGKEVMRRGFAFKPCYLNEILHDRSYLKKDNFSVKDQTLQEAVIERFNRFIGMDIRELRDLAMNHSSCKQSLYMLARYMAVGNAKGGSISEFQKAGVMMKTIRVNSNGRPFETMTFPAFDYMEIAETEWEESEFRSILDNRFLLVIFDKKDDRTIFRKAVFWMIPESDLNRARRVWMDTKDKILSNRYDDFITYQCNTDMLLVKTHSVSNGRKLLCPDGSYRKQMCFAISINYLESVLMTI